MIYKVRRIYERSLSLGQKRSYITDMKKTLKLVILVDVQLSTVGSLPYAPLNHTGSTSERFATTEGR